MAAPLHESIRHARNVQQQVDLLLAEIALFVSPMQIVEKSAKELLTLVRSILLRQLAFGLFLRPCKQQIVSLCET